MLKTVNTQKNDFLVAKVDLNYIKMIVHKLRHNKSTLLAQDCNKGAVNSAEDF